MDFGHDRVSVEPVGRSREAVELRYAEITKVGDVPPKFLKPGVLGIASADLFVALRYKRRDQDAARKMLDRISSQAIAARSTPPAPARSLPRAPQPTPRPKPERVLTGDLFVYPSALTGGAADTEYAFLDLETSGLHPKRGARVLEVGIVRTDAHGAVLAEWSTLVNPGRGKDVGPAHIHRITDRMVADAPRFADIVNDLLCHLEGAVVVAHNATFENTFLRYEFERAGVPVAAMPALDTLPVARQVVSTPNHRLATVADWAGVDLVDAHTALGDARALSKVLPVIVSKNGLAPFWHTSPPVFRVAPGGQALGRPHGDPFAAEAAGYELAHGLRKGDAGWIGNLLLRMPETAGENDTSTQPYIEVLTAALADGRITGDEARELAIMAGSLGLTSERAQQLHRDVLEAMRSVALADGVLTRDEYRLLSKAAHQVGEDGYFSDLEPTAVAVSASSAGGTRKRCGNCGGLGHNRRTCVAA